MPIKESMKERFSRLLSAPLLSAPGDEIGRWGRLLRFQIQLWRFCARRLHDNNSMAMSSALSFRTIFVMVPAVFLAVLVFRAAGILDDSKLALRDVLESSEFARITVAGPQGEVSTRANQATRPATSSAPAKIINVADEAESFLNRIDNQLTVARVGPIGLVLLIWTSITLLTTLERSLNRIFGAPRPRSLGRRTLLYWAAISLGPLALFGANYLGGKLQNMFADTPVISWLLAISGWAGPVIVGVVLLAALYKLMPNTHVSFRSAMGGAIIAVPLWLACKWAVKLYVVEIVGKGSFYGALGLVPLFLLWLNLSWLIVLFGAELAHTAVNLKQMTLAEQARKVILSPWHLLGAALVVANSYRRGQSPATLEAVFTKLNLLGESALRIMDQLTEAGIVCPVDGDDENGEKYLPARPAEKILVTEILDAAGPGTNMSSPQMTDMSIAHALAKVRQKTSDAMGPLTLADVMGWQ